MLDDLRGNSGGARVCLAAAIYDNIADAPDELPFRKGECLTVLEQNTGGLEGWWLCALKGMQGICPGNRLRLLPTSSALDTDPQLSLINSQTNKVVTPKRVGDVYLYSGSGTQRNSCQQNYDVPPSSKLVSTIPSENYDFPRSQMQYDNPRSLYDTPKSSLTINETALISGHNALVYADIQGEEYDIPRTDTADRASKISFLSADSPFSQSAATQAPGLSLTPLQLSSCSLNVYDVPPEPKQFIKQTKPNLPPRVRKCVGSTARSNQESFDVVYDIPPQVSREPCVDTIHRLSTEFDTSGIDIGSIWPQELPLELNSAKDTLAKLEQEVYRSLEKFLGLKIVENEIKTAALTLKNALDEIVKFALGSVCNAMKLGNDTLSKKIYQLMKPVCSVQLAVTDACNKCTPVVQQGLFNFQNQVAGLTRLKDDVRYLSNTIQAHSHLIFKRSPTISLGNSARLNEPDIFGNENYANMNSQLDKNNSVQTKYFGESQLYENGLIVKSTMKTEINLSTTEKQVINFYGTQAKLHLQNMNATIDSFLLTIENNQPPKVFINHSKFVILAAHRMVYIGDTAHRNICDETARTGILNRSNNLCDAMRNAVLATKTAALQFPSVGAVQAMIDAFVSISHLANSLKGAICCEQS